MSMDGLASAIVWGYHHVLLLVLVTLLGRTVWMVAYRLYFHPLAKYPGPLLAKLTGLYMIVRSAQCQSTYTRDDLHHKYGNAVRVGPNELSFCDMESVKDIYGQSGEPCLKASAFYDGFTLTGTASVFSATGRNVHGRMRRLLSHGFSERGVLQFQPDIASIIDKFLECLRSRGSGESINIHDMTHNLYLDISSQLSFAQSFHILRDGKTHQGAQDIDTYFSIAPLYGIFPLAKYLPFGIFRAAKESRPRIVRSVQSNIDDFRTRLQAGTAQSGLLRLMVEATDHDETKSDSGVAFSDAELIENAVLFIVAGSATTASTLLYLIYEVGKRPTLQQRLQQEIRAAFSDQSIFPEFETARQLPFLHNVVQETLRLRAPIPSVAPRVSPGKRIGNSFVPAGVIVSNLPYTTHRDAAVFPHPHDFIPDRWSPENVSPAMTIMHRPFSSGPRNCLGMHLARVQLLLTVCALYLRFDIELDCQRTTEEKMVMRDQGLLTPIGKELWVKLAPRNEE